MYGVTVRVLKRVYHLQDDPEIWTKQVVGKNKNTDSTK
jgi:hypothetical protein